MKCVKKKEIIEQVTRLERRLANMGIIQTGDMLGYAGVESSTYVKEMLTMGEIVFSQKVEQTSDTLRGRMWEIRKKLDNLSSLW